MTAADKLRELLATGPAMPTLDELTRWWVTTKLLLPEVLDAFAEPLRQRLEGLEAAVAADVRRLDVALTKIGSMTSAFNDVEGVARHLAFMVGVKREKPTCKSCGRTSDDHNVRHPFVLAESEPGVRNG